MSVEDLQRYESEVELDLYRQYREVVGMFRHVVETERRFYLANTVEHSVHTDGGRTRVELLMTDAWVWDMYRQTKMRFVPSVRVVTFKDVNIEELAATDLDL